MASAALKYSICSIYVRQLESSSPKIGLNIKNIKTAWNHPLLLNLSFFPLWTTINHFTSSSNQYFSQPKQIRCFQTPALQGGARRPVGLLGCLLGQGAAPSDVMGDCFGRRNHTVAQENNWDHSANQWCDQHIIYDIYIYIDMMLYN